MSASEREPTAVPPLVSAVLSLFAAPRINMREDYEKVRSAQRAFAWVPRDKERIFDQLVLTEEGREIPVRVFLPKEHTREGISLFFHGGGWATGDVDTYASACRTMADLTGQTVAAVDYRLAPEHPFPAGLDDCLAVTRRLLGVVDARDVVLVGDSAGGNLTAAVTLVLRAEGHEQPAAQVLLYPVLQWDHDPETSPFPSVAEYGTGLRLTSIEVHDYLSMYEPDPDRRREPLVSPLAADDLSGLPRALVMTAELDLLRDEGEAYGYALRAAGTPARIERVDGALHGFISLPRLARPLTHAYQLINSFLDGDLADSRALPELRLDESL